MCGICGFITKQKAEPEIHQSALSAMLERIIHRGPDESGVYHSTPIHMGMRRLSIIDIQGGHQPLHDSNTNSENGTSMVYNGELYNYRELKKDLLQNEVNFSTSSDSEVVLQSFIHFKNRCWNQFNGMFAVALWEPKQQQLTLARDRFGQKPLYYIHRPDFFAFASDTRSLLAHPAVQFSLQHDVIPLYLQHRHVPGAQTLIKDIKQLAPGSYMTVNRNFDVTIRRYWHPEFKIDPDMTINNFQEQFGQLWPTVIQRHLLSDVPVGGFLSGGIDSSLIALEASKQKANFQTLSIGFTDPDFDESQWAKKIADFCGCQHQLFNFSGTLSSMLELWTKAYDQPFSDPACFPLLALCEHARKNMTVALSGDGADELFAGYQRYNSLLLSNKIRKLPAFLRNSGGALLGLLAKLFPAKHKTRRYLDAVNRRLSLINGELYQEYLNQFQLFDDATLDQVLLKTNQHKDIFGETKNPHMVHNLLEHDLNHWLPDQMLVKTDRASMGVSLETRLPFLDNEIVDLALRTPHHLMIHKRQLKYSLRSVAANTLPAEVSQRRKHGFAIPVDQWLRNESDWVQDIIRDGIAQSPDLFHFDYVQKLLKLHFSNRQNFGEPLLTLLLFFVWQKNLSTL